MTGVVFKVLNRQAPWRLVAPLTQRVAQQVAQEAAARSPHGDTGALASGWQVVPGRRSGVWVVRNEVPYVKYVEFGTRFEAAQPMIGPVLAAYRAGMRR